MKLSCIFLPFAIARVASAQKLGFAGNVMNQNEFSQFEAMSDAERIMELTKTVWPECLEGRLKKADRCKELIDTELADMNLSFPVETMIVYARSFHAPTSHAIIITTDDDGMCIGNDGDGILTYEFKWCINDEEVLTDPEKIKASRSLIQPTRWSKLRHLTNDYDCSAVDPDGSLEDWHTNVLDEMGGHFEVACSTTAGMLKLDDAISAGAVLRMGCHELDPIDCNGLSGVDACLMVKSMVPFHNNDDENMECLLQYRPGSPKHNEIRNDLLNAEYELPIRVVIVADYNSYHVVSPPRMKGPWESLV